MIFFRSNDFGLVSHSNTYKSKVHWYLSSKNISNLSLTQIRNTKLVAKSSWALNWKQLTLLEELTGWCYGHLDVHSICSSHGGAMKKSLLIVKCTGNPRRRGQKAGWRGWRLMMTHRKEEEVYVFEKWKSWHVAERELNNFCILKSAIERIQKSRRISTIYNSKPHNITSLHLYGNHASKCITKYRKPNFLYMYQSAGYKWRLKALFIIHISKFQNLLYHSQLSFVIM